MTWLKLSDDFADQCAKVGLSDAAFRTHVEALVWTMRRETDGCLSTRDVTRLGESHDLDQAVKELLAAGFWTVEGAGYRIVHHMEHQPESDVIQARRTLATARQTRYRRKKAGLSSRDESRDETRDMTRDPGRVGTGRVGTGQAL